MLSFFTNLFPITEMSTQAFITNISMYSYTQNVNNTANLMLQFGILVFILSFLALAVPNYFGLYGSLVLTIIPLFLAFLYSLFTFQYIYDNSTIVFINGFK